MNLSGAIDEHACSRLAALASSTAKVLVVSEIGLDFVDGAPDRAVQYQAFREQVRLALDTKLPIVFHSRDAHEETLRVLREERAYEVDAFVALTNDDEHNVLAAARAKSMGAKSAIAVLQRPTYQHLLKHVGIDHSFSPRVSAVTEIRQLLRVGPVSRLATVARGVADVWEISVPAGAGQVLGKTLRELRFPPKTIVAAIQRGDEAHVPSPDDTIAAGDTVVIISPQSNLKDLKKMFGL